MEQSKKSAITRQKILTAAENEFANYGLAAARVDTIAKEAGVNKQLIYAHFSNKDGLYIEVLSQVYQRVYEYEEFLAASEFEGIETIHNIILKYFDFLLKNPNFVRLMLWENLNYADYVGNIKTTLFSGCERLLKKGVEEGIFRKNLDIEQTVISLNLFCFSAFSNIYTVSKLLHKDLTTEEELKKRAEHIADVLTKYILYQED